MPGLAASSCPAWIGSHHSRNSILRNRWGIPVTPFGPWSYDFTEEQAEELLQNCPAGCVLVSHSPPKGGSIEPEGSVAVRDAVTRLQPLLVVCGHIHACAGQEGNIGPIPVLNAGPKGIEWELR